MLLQEYLPGQLSFLVYFYFYFVLGFSRVTRWAHVYVFMCRAQRTCVCTYVCVHMHLHTHTRASPTASTGFPHVRHRHVCMPTYRYVLMCVHICACSTPKASNEACFYSFLTNPPGMHTCIYVCVYLCGNLCMHTYRNAYEQRVCLFVMTVQRTFSYRPISSASIRRLIAASAALPVASPSAATRSARVGSRSAPNADVAATTAFSSAVVGLCVRGSNQRALNQRTPPAPVAPLAKFARASNLPTADEAPLADLSAGGEAPAHAAKLTRAHARFATAFPSISRMRLERNLESTKFGKNLNLELKKFKCKNSIKKLS